MKTTFDIGYKFNNEKLLITALTHSSYKNENKHSNIEYNERLEFLGDSILSVITSEFLFTHYKNLPEGDLTKIRAALVCEQSLYLYSKKLNVGKYLFLGKGEEMTHGRERISILADAFEAILGAVYLDGGLESAREFALPFIKANVDNAIDGKMFKDYKTQLQEIVQQNPGEKLIYRLASQSGPDHNKVFEVEVLLNSNILGKGVGRSKKEAEQSAAKKAMEFMGQ